MAFAMELVQIYECLCDVTRLRLLNVLAQGPLCVCHFQEILGEPQVKISKHLAYLRERGLVECERQGNWVVYELPAKPSRELKANLACLQDCAREDPVFKRDLARLKKIEPSCAWVRNGEPENAPGQCRCGG
jgi:ArsR family transcriptional regulator